MELCDTIHMHDTMHIPPIILFVCARICVYVGFFPIAYSLYRSVYFTKTYNNENVYMQCLW